MAVELKYKTLWIVGLSPRVEEALARYTEREGEPSLVFRCAEARIWDPYGSLARSVLSALVRYPTIRQVWVLGDPEEAEAPLRLDAGAQHNELQTIHYLLDYHLELNSHSWMEVKTSSFAHLEATSRLLQGHALLPEGVEVAIGVLAADGHITSLTH